MKKIISVLLTSSVLLGFGLWSTEASAEKSSEMKSTENETIISSEVEEGTVTSSEIEKEITIPTTEEESPDVTKEESIIDESTDPSEVVDSIIADIIGEQIGEEVPLDSNATTSEIREILSDPIYGISKEELDGYTDEQLTNTMTLFNRYGHDNFGMDYGSYTRLLRALYLDKTINADQALAQLAQFNPADFNSFSEMIPYVAQLQVYLRILYPANSSFMSCKELTDGELISKLESLQKWEDRLIADGQTLACGRIAPIIRISSESNETVDESTDSTNTSDTTTTSEKLGSTETTPSKEAVTTPSSSNKKGFLPQTGESKATIILPLIGGIALITLFMIFIKKFKKIN